MMKFLIRGDKVKVTESIKKYAQSKLSRISKYFDTPDEITINSIIRVRNNKQIIEVTIPTKKYTLRAEEINDDLYAAIDLVIDKLERQIRKNKTRLKDKFKKEEIPEFIFDFEEEIENNDKIIKRKNLDIKPMDEEEAILQMELIDHDFFVFKNIKEECISVLYKRKDGNYGIINTK